MNGRQVICEETLIRLEDTVIFVLVLSCALRSITNPSLLHLFDHLPAIADTFSFYLELNLYADK